MINKTGFKNKLVSIFFTLVSLLGPNLWAGGGATGGGHPYLGEFQKKLEMISQELQDMPEWVDPIFDGDPNSKDYEENLRAKMITKINLRPIVMCANDEQYAKISQVHHTLAYVFEETSDEITILCTPMKNDKLMLKDNASQILDHQWKEYFSDNKYNVFFIHELVRIMGLNEGKNSNFSMRYSNAKNKLNKQLKIIAGVTQFLNTETTAAKKNGKCTFDESGLINLTSLRTFSLEDHPWKTRQKLTTALSSIQKTDEQIKYLTEFYNLLIQLACIENQTRI